LEVGNQVLISTDHFGASPLCHFGGGGYLSAGQYRNCHVVASGYRTYRLHRALPSHCSPRPPIGTAWVHEIKQDGIRVIARKTQFGVRLYSRSGNDLAQRFPLIAETVARLPARSCIIDGEAVSCGDDGIAVFERILYKRYDHTVFLYAFDIVELNGEDLRPEPLEARKATLGSLLACAGIGVRLNEHLEHANGVHVFERACRMGLEGIVSKRKGSRYHSGRTLDWMKATNPNAPAVTRAAKEDWGPRAKPKFPA
jgi:bifunctional non-homologous end joining protein LigD